MDRRELGQQVLKRRKSLGLSQFELARTAGVSRNYVSLIERGKVNVSMDILNRLAVILEATLAELIGQSSPDDTIISPTLRELSLKDGLSFEIVDRLSRIPKQGQEPRTVKEWRGLYRAVRPYIEDSRRSEN